MKLIKVVGKEILCNTKSNYTIIEIDRNKIKEVPEDRAVLETRWCQPIKTFKYREDLYIAEIAFDYWEIQSRISDWLMVREPDDVVYDEKYIEIRGVILDCYSDKELPDIFYNGIQIGKIRSILKLGKIRSILKQGTV